MKELKTYAQEPYEAPAISEIAPVTLVYGSAGGEASGGEGGEHYPNPDDEGFD